MLKLPVEDILPDLRRALDQNGCAVLQAPPGAGKTTRVPLFLLEQRLIFGRIIMLEPRRVAARAAAERLASELGEKVGERIGYRIRGEKKSGKNTIIEVVTEGVLTRILQNDQELSGIGCVIFDEFHERSIHADLGLALCLETREVLRPDLKLLVMSATLDAEPVAKMMGNAPIVTSAGRSFDVETFWLDKPWKKPNQRRGAFEDATIALVEKAISETDGGVLVFLPGASEIHRIQSGLANKLSNDCIVMPLYGGLPFSQQKQVLNPLKTGRKIVLATSIAETSLTIPDIRVVVDAGLARRARFDAGSGMSRLVTERVTKAEATQRRGRAGRVTNGWCYRLWTKGEEGGMIAFPPPEIAASDLTPLVLELAQWGANSAKDLSFLTQPPETQLIEAQNVLKSLNALDENGNITDTGQEMARLPLHPRLAHMLVEGAKNGSRKLAATLAALQENKDIIRGAVKPVDMLLRLEAVQNPDKFEAERPYTIDRQTLKSVRDEIKRLEKLVPEENCTSLSPDILLSFAFPDRIGMRRKGDTPRFLLSGGKGAIINNEDNLTNARIIIANELDGDLREAKVYQGIETSEKDIRKHHTVKEVNVCEWSKKYRAIIARKRVVLGAIILEEQHWKDVTKDDVATAMLDGVHDLGLQALDWKKAANLLRARVQWLYTDRTSLPDMSDKHLLDTLESWLHPFLGNCRRADDLKKVDVHAALDAMLDWDSRQILDKHAPSHIIAPTGTKLAIDYDGDVPSVSVRLQEMFGLTTHPTVGPKRIPLLIHLLSPASRPVQSTSDLPRFWQETYNDVRKDMRGRYPRHPWPEDPTQAAPTRRAKPRSI